MSFKQAFYPESKFGGFTDIDGTIAFYNRVNALIEPSFVVLDLGCGRGAYIDDPVHLRRNLRKIKTKCRRVIGIDVDEAASKNPFLDDFCLLLNTDHLPLEDDSIDLVLCDYVLEHIVEPNTFFSEIYRVLKDGGYLCLRTPNSWNYVAIFSRLIPNRYHARVAVKVQESRKEEDVFPTYYRCNSVWRLRAILTKYSFDHVVYGYEAEPSYLSFSKVAYGVGVLHQRFVPGFLKSMVFAFGRITKPKPRQERQRRSLNSA